MKIWSNKLIRHSYVILLPFAIVIATIYLYLNVRESCPMGSNTLGQVPYIIVDSTVCKLIGTDPNKSPNHFYSRYVIVPDRDAKTFQVIQGKEIYLSIYSKDKNGVYFADERIEGADPTTFAILSDVDFNGGVDFFYSKDKTHAFFVGYGKSIIISNDPQSFRTLGYGYSTDIHDVYIWGEKLLMADPGTFQVFSDVPSCNGSDVYAKDATKVYFDGKQIIADAGTFVSLGYGVGKDKSHIYWHGKISENSLNDLSPLLQCQYGKGL